MAAWLTVPIYGSWFWPNGDLRPGTYVISSDSQVSSEIGGGVVLPKGVVRYGNLNIDESNGLPSFSYISPAADDPDMFPNGFTLRVIITPEGSDQISFLLQPSVLDLEDEDAGINLNHIVSPDLFPPGTPFPAAGVRGGLARLDPITGQVLDANGNRVLSGDGELTDEERAAVTESILVEIDDQLEPPIDLVLLYENAKV